MSAFRRPAVIFAAVFLLSAYFAGLGLSFICEICSVFFLPVFIYYGISKKLYRKAFFVFIIIFTLLYPGIHKNLREYKTDKIFDSLSGKKSFTATVIDISYNGKSINFYADIFGKDGKNMGKAVFSGVYPDKLCDIYDCIYFEGKIHLINKDTVSKLSLYGNENFYFSKNCLFAVETESITVLGRLPEDKRSLADSFYFYISDNLKNKAPIIDGADPFSYISALLMGNRSFLSNETKQVFSGSGLMPYLCVSGLHISLVTSILIFILRILRIKGCLRFLISSLFLIFICSVTHFSGSVMRASLMCFSVLLGELAGKKYDRFVSLATALFIILVFNPFAFFDVGTQLSFLAMLGVCNSLYFVSARDFNKNGASQKLKLPFLTSIMASSFVFVPLIFIFGGAYLLSPIANLPALIFTPIMYLVVFMGIFAFFPKAILLPFGYVFSNLVLLFQKLAEGFAAVPFSYTKFPCPETLLFLFVFLLFFNILCISALGERKIFYSGVFSSAVIYTSVFSMHLMKIIM